MTSVDTNGLKLIGIIASGSRGDIQPYIAMAVCFKKSGYDVAVLTNPNHASFVRDFAIKCYCTTFDSETQLRENEVLRKSMEEGDVSLFVAGARGFIEKFGAKECQRFLQYYEEVQPDLLVCAPTAEYFQTYAKMVLKLPVVRVSLQGVVYDPDRVMWGLPSSMPKDQYREVWVGIIANIYDRFGHFDKAMADLGYMPLVPLIPRENYLRNRESPKFPELICQPALFKKILYPKAHENFTFVGASILSSSQQREHNSHFGGNGAEKAIEKFLADSDTKPVYCGWGSMTCKSSEYMVKFAVRALMLSRQRGIVLGGWAGLTLDVLRSSVTDEEEKDLLSYAEKNILFVEEASHENLFPRVSCVVHHGGAGTTNAALRAGVPSIITPVFLDQYDHAFLVEELGVGVGFKDSQLQKLKAEELADAITKCLCDDKIAARADEVGRILAAEDDAEAVVSYVKQFWENDVITGKFKACVEEDIAVFPASLHGDSVPSHPTE